jgi:hypothetical protein
MEKSVAILTIKGAGNMTQESREQLAEWLKQHADDLVQDGWNYSNRFIGRYIYVGDGGS